MSFPQSNARYCPPELISCQHPVSGFSHPMSWPGACPSRYVKKGESQRGKRRSKWSQRAEYEQARVQMECRAKSQHLEQEATQSNDVSPHHTELSPGGHKHLQFTPASRVTDYSASSREFRLKALLLSSQKLWVVVRL